MTIKEQIVCAIELYNEGGYFIATFFDVFSQLYYYETGGHKYFSLEERIVLDHVGEVASRHTADEEDLKKTFQGHTILMNVQNLR
jgi:hypothetical protein